MDFVFLVQEVQGGQHLPQHTADGVSRHRLRFDLAGQGALHQLHHDPSSILVDGVNSQHVLVFKLSQKAGLFQELFDAVGVCLAAV